MIRVVLPSWYSPTAIPSMAEAISAWNVQNPDAPIRPETQYGKRSNLFQKIVLGLKRGGFADAVLVRNEWIGRLAADGLIRKVRQDFATKIQAEALPPIFESIGEAQGLWAVPFDADAYVLWLRQDLIKENHGVVGVWNAQILKKCARIMSEDIGDNQRRFGFAFATGQNATSSLAFLPWYFAFGGRISDEWRQISFDAKAAQMAMEYLRGFATENLAPDTAASLETNDVFSGLAGGAYGMTLGGSWERGMLKKQSRFSDVIVSLPLPGFGDNPGATLIGGWSFVLAKNGHERVDEFLFRLFSADTQRKKLQQNSLLPVNRLVLGDPWFAHNPDGPTFKKSLETGRSLPFNVGVAKTLDRISLMLSEVFLGRKSTAPAAADAGNDISNFRQ